jgi:hypothetical protein
LKCSAGGRRGLVGLIISVIQQYISQAGENTLCTIKSTANCTGHVTEGKKEE